ncbi:MAG: hypothetical protein DSY34_01480 [Desulfurobacterium sp.]|nr:MAG: hypothetical protein DSY34_01480 [Desulfurobacterium sp.]
MSKSNLLQIVKSKIFGNYAPPTISSELNHRLLLGFRIIGIYKNYTKDNGSEFLGEFEKYPQERGIQHYSTYPRSPKTNVEVERFIQTTETELWVIEWTEPIVEEMNRKLLNWIRIYNFIRPYCSLNYKTPAEKFEDYIRSHQCVHHVLNSNKHLTPEKKHLYYSPSSECRLSSAG